MAYSELLYTGDGTTIDYGVTFDYLDKSHVAVAVNKVLTSAVGASYKFEFPNSSTVRVRTVIGDNPVPNGIEVRVFRRTPINVPAVVFGGGASLSSSNLNKNSEYLTYALQEATDSNDAFTTRYLGAFETSPTVDNTGGTLIVGAMYFKPSTGNLYFWNGTSWKLGDLLESTISAKDAAEVARDITVAARDAAQAAETNAANSEANALASKNAAASSETNAANSETTATASKNTAVAAKDTAVAAKDTAVAAKDTAVLRAAEAVIDANNAAADALAAANSAGAASTSETNAANSAAAAASSETNAANSASAAAISASTFNSALFATAAQGGKADAAIPSPASPVDGDLLVRSSGAWARLPKGTADQVLTINAGATAPEWADAAASPVKAWVNFNGTGVVAIRDSFNVSSITDNGPGNYSINFTTAMPDANYVVIGSAGATIAQLILSPSSAAGQTASTCRVIVSNTASLADNPLVNVAIIR